MRKFFIAALAVITFIPALTWLVSCLTPYISPVHFWPMAFLALGSPYVALVILILAFVWLFIRKKVAIFLFLLFFAGFQNLFATFALNPVATPPVAKDSGSLRILTWNVRGFDNPTIGADSLTSTRAQMFGYIARVQPDVLCLQEFVEHHLPGTFSNTQALQKLGYIYYYKSNEVIHRINGWAMVTSSAIFSKKPIIDSAKVMLGDSSYPEYLASADISFQNKTLRVFATHFKSINLFAQPTDKTNKVIFYGDSDFVYHSTKFEKLKAFGQAHSKEALIAKEVMNRSPFPVILGADMNSVPTSYAYHTMAAGLQDAFKLNGWGLGTTMEDLPKTLRIDYLLVDKKLLIKNFHKDDVSLSDHFPQFIDVSWRNK